MDRLRFAFLLSIMWSAAILAAIIAVFMTVNGAHAQESGVCHDFEIVKGALAEEYGEIPSGMGLTNQGRAMVLFHSPETGTWTIVEMDATGRACGRSSGEAWEYMDQPQPPVPGKRPA